MGKPDCATESTEGHREKSRFYHPSLGHPFEQCYVFLGMLDRRVGSIRSRVINLGKVIGGHRGSVRVGGDLRIIATAARNTPGTIARLK
ncbi:hypothetical protein BH23PLA1_BH23PLA1_03960 [soil metagenome]